jgi:hypothetical protein
MNDRRSVVLSAVLAFALLVTGVAAAGALRPGQGAPEIAGERWINSEPLTTGKLLGRVVLVEFWTYG